MPKDAFNQTTRINHTAASPDLEGYDYYTYKVFKADMYEKNSFSIPVDWSYLVLFEPKWYEAGYFQFYTYVQPRDMPDDTDTNPTATSSSDSSSFLKI